MTNSTEKNNVILNFLNCICYFLWCVFGLSLIAAAAAYLVLGIIYLVQDFNTAKACKDSNLWAYVLVCIILASNKSQLANAKNEKNNDIWVLIGNCLCIILIDGALAIWGGIELFSKACSDLKETNLYIFAQVTFIIQVTFISLCMIIMICSITYKCCELSQTNNENNDIEKNLNK